MEKPAVYPTFALIVGKHRTNINHTSSQYAFPYDTNISVLALISFVEVNHTLVTPPRVEVLNFEFEPLHCLARLLLALQSFAYRAKPD